MPILRLRGGNRMPCSGAETTAPPMAIVPPLGCSRPATQRSVVVLPHPEGPSSTTISPAATAKLTSSTAGRPTANTLRSRSTRSSADMAQVSALARPMLTSLAIAVGLVPLLHPLRVELLILVEIGHPYLDDLGIEALGIERWRLERSEIAELLDHERLALLRQAPVEKQPRGVGMRRGLGNAAGIGVDRRALGRKKDLERRAVALLGPDDVVEQRRDLHFAAHQRVGERRTRGVEHRLGRRLLLPVVLAQSLALEHDARPCRAAGRADDLADGAVAVFGLGQVHP